MRFLGGKNHQAPEEPTEEEFLSAFFDMTGRRFGDFAMGSLLHRGSQSVLFDAHDQVRDRRAIVKVVLPPLMARERSRFVREVPTLVNVRHVNLVEVFGVGRQGPFCWCAMEYVDGISVREMIEPIGTPGRLDWRGVLHVATHVARALDCAYRHNIVHRNLSPDSLLMNKNTKLVKLCDLMLGKGLEYRPSDPLTREGQKIGDVAYMSPERIKDASAIDWRADQYGLGATLFALLSGNPPFAGSSCPALVKAIRETRPCLPEAVKRKADHDFLAIVYKMLEKDRSGRFVFPGELLSVLEELGRDKSLG